MATDNELNEHLTNIIVDTDEPFPPVHFDVPLTQHSVDVDDPLFVFLISPGEFDSAIPISNGDSVCSPFSDQWKKA